MGAGDSKVDGGVGMSKYLITISELIAQLNYEPETGIFTWKKAKRGHTKAGAKAGTIRPNGYINITINRKPYYAHRLAWFYTTGQWPTHHIDHINGVRDDNRIENLREADRKSTRLNSSHSQQSRMPSSA